MENHFLKIINACGSPAWVAWNLMLAAIPVLLAYLLVSIARLRRHRHLRKILLTVVGAAWLVFLPNTCYLLTEWRHFLYNLDASNLFLRSRAEPDLKPALMIYTAAYTLYSASGMLAFTLAIRPVAKMMKRSGRILWIYGLPLFLLMSIGVYLGLVLRFNSWDVLKRPNDIWQSVSMLISRPKLALLIVGFGGFLWLAYFLIDTLIDSVRAKLHLNHRR